MVRSSYLFELGWTQFLWLQFSCSYINIPNFISIKKLKQLILNLSHLLKSIGYRRIIWLISVQCFVSYRHQSFHLICTANQMTDFYMRCITVLTWVKAKAKYLFKLFAPNAPFLYPLKTSEILRKNGLKKGGRGQGFFWGNTGRQVFLFFSKMFTWAFLQFSYQWIILTTVSFVCKYIRMFLIIVAFMVYEIICLRRYFLTRFFSLVTSMTLCC